MADNTSARDPLSILDHLLSAARREGASSADAIWVNSSDTTVKWRMNAQEGIERAETMAVGLRVFYGKQQANVSTSDCTPDHLRELAARAVAMAKIAPPDPFLGLAEEALLARNIPDLDLFDAKEPSAGALIELAKQAEDSARGVKGVTNSEGADASHSRYHVTLMTRPEGGKGFSGSYRASNSSVSVSVLAGSGTNMERDYDYASVRRFADLPDMAAIGISAGEKAVKRLNPRKMDSCRVPIVFDPRVSKSLLGYVAGAISGSAIARGTSFLKDALGSSIFASNITITDDPHRPRGLASKPFDGEGVAGRVRNIVENGVLTTWLLDVRSANQLNLKSTGHASRGVGSPPSPSSSNLFMQAGSITPAALMRDIKQGFYVTDTFGMGVNLITGDYSQGASGFWIENGEIAYPVSEITIAGQLKDMFAHLIPADDLVFRYGTNVPTLRIEGMTVAGK